MPRVDWLDSLREWLDAGSRKRFDKPRPHDFRSSTQGRQPSGRSPSPTRYARQRHRCPLRSTARRQTLVPATEGLPRGSTQTPSADLGRTGLEWALPTRVCRGAPGALAIPLRTEFEPSHLARVPTQKHDWKIPAHSIESDLAPSSLRQASRGWPSRAISPAEPARTSPRPIGRENRATPDGATAPARRLLFLVRMDSRSSAFGLRSIPPAIARAGPAPRPSPRWCERFRHSRPPASPREHGYPMESKPLHQRGTHFRDGLEVDSAVLRET